MPAPNQVMLIYYCIDSFDIPAISMGPFQRPPHVESKIGPLPTGLLDNRVHCTGDPGSTESTSGVQLTMRASS